MTFTCAKEAPGNATAASTTKTAVMRPRFRRSKSAFSLTLHLLNKPQRIPGLAAIVSIIALFQERGSWERPHEMNDCFHHRTFPAGYLGRPEMTAYETFHLRCS